MRYSGAVASWFFLFLFFFSPFSFEITSCFLFVVLLVLAVLLHISKKYYFFYSKQKSTQAVQKKVMGSSPLWFTFLQKFVKRCTFGVPSTPKYTKMVHPVVHLFTYTLFFPFPSKKHSNCSCFRFQIITFKVKYAAANRLGAIET